MTREYRREDIKVGPESGSYVTVYQRPGEEPKADLNFFDGDRSRGDVSRLAEALVKAEQLMIRWGTEG